ncbi:MAG: putative integral rane ClpP-type serine endoprotease [Nitrososphaeraceae archaeon]|nr:putative integral rane ClpP-type serine endoprotease [Nitrososphaeraceae archaeon]
MRFVLSSILIALSLILLFNLSIGSLSGQSENDVKKKVLWVDVKDFISSATSENIATAIEQASSSSSSSTTTNDQEYYSAIILALDTPGGSLDATLSILESMQKSPIPIITYVYPQGKSAWSAGTIILIAGDYAAMAPVTTIGSAQPVLGNQPVNDTKTINAVKEKVVSLSELHGRNTTQAARFITHNDNLTPEKALDRNIIETIAENPQDLLNKAHNATITTKKGIKVLDISDAEIVKHEPTLRVMLVDFLSNPLISTTFMTIGFFALIYGFTSPGFGVEIAAAILIILSLVGQGFNINWAALALLAIGVGLLGYELYSPSFGAIGIGGIVVIVIGTSLMITQPVQDLLIKEEHLGNLAVLSSIVILPFGAFFGVITYKVWQTKKKKKIEFVLQSNEGTALDTISDKKDGFVLVGGEYWKAKSIKSDINKGEKVRVIDKQGHFLIVESI